MTAEAVLRERLDRKDFRPLTSRLTRKGRPPGHGHGLRRMRGVFLPQVCKLPVDPVQGQCAVEGGVEPPMPVDVGRVKAGRIEPQLLSKLGAQALVLLSASHNYSSAVGSVVRRSCPAPDGKGRFVIRATQ